MKVYHWFISNRKNKFHPAALRTTGLIIFLAIFLAIPLTYNIITARQFRVLGYATNVNINDLFNLGNQERTNAGLATLSLNTELSNAAFAKANDMITDNYWAHVAPDGTTPWSFINSAGYKYSAAGENLAKDFNTSSGVIAGWMGSQTHKDNVLNSTYQDVGYAVVNGVLNGSETTLVVAMYGLKSQTSVAVIAASDSQTPNTVSPEESTVSSNAETTTKTQPLTTDEETSTLLPVRVYNSLNWGQKISILLICTLILLFALKHTAIWREQKRGLKHIWLRAHPLGQITILTVALVITIVSGTGAIL